MFTRLIQRKTAEEAKEKSIREEEVTGVVGHRSEGSPTLIWVVDSRERERIRSILLWKEKSQVGKGSIQNINKLSLGSTWVRVISRERRERESESGSGRMKVGKREEEGVRVERLKTYLSPWKVFLHLPRRVEIQEAKAGSFFLDCSCSSLRSKSCSKTSKKFFWISRETRESIS